MKTLFISLSLLLLLNCNNNDDSTPFEPIEIEFSTVGIGLLGGNGDEGILESNLVITNSTDWTNLMNQMDSDSVVTDSFSETDIDFDNFLVLAIFLEVKLSVWYVEINSIIENENSIVVSYSDNGTPQAAITQPYHIVEIPVTSKPIEFINN